MIKVFLVEDEVVIRNGIKNSIDWEKEGYQFAGEASDGELALPMILKEKPDIVITDIRMPFMDGLELSRMVKKELPDTKIVILSGYDDFDYAKEAIRIGVTEYLLKPVSSAMLLEHLQEVSETIRKEREDQTLKETYLQEMRENEELIKMKFLGELLSGEMSLSAALEKGKRFHMNLSAQTYQVILFKFMARNQADAQSSEEAVAAYESVETFVDSFEDVYAFQRGVEGWAFLVTSEEAELEEKTKKFLEQLTELLKQFDKMDYFGGIGMPVTRLRELRYSFRDADRAFAGRFTQEENQILSSSELPEQPKDDDFDVNSVGELNQIQHVIEKFLNNGSQEEVSSFVEALFEEVPREHFRSLIIRQYVIMNIYATVASFCEKISADKEKTAVDEEAQLDDLKKREQLLKNAVTSSESLDDIRKYISDLLENAIELRNTVSGRRYSDIIMTAKRRIEADYMSEDISLNTVAMDVGMSPSYFSSIFSKEMGKTFIEYLTEIRMEKAKEYLTCSSMKSSEIGYEVGYKDPHYFSYIFKKTQGCTPKEYRLTRKG